MDFIARCLFATSIFPLAPFFSFFLLHIPQAPYSFFLRFFFLVPLQVLLNDLPFAQVSLTSLSCRPLHYEVQLKITSRQITFNLLDSCLHYILLIHLLSVTVSKDQAGSTDRCRPIPFKFAVFFLYQITLRSLVFLVK